MGCRCRLTFCWGELGLLLAIFLAGCGTTKSQLATEQLLTSDAVDRTVSQLDFRDLAGQKVFLETKYIQNVKGIGFVNSEYVISSLRQQMFAAHCKVQETVETADYIVEARVGTLGTDAHDVTYGLPANNVLSSAATLIPNSPGLPALPEIALAKRNEQVGAVKLAVFAYRKDTQDPVWQSGIAKHRSRARDIWVFGAGPFQQGTIYDGTEFAGGRLGLPGGGGNPKDFRNVPMVAHDREVHFLESADYAADVQDATTDPPALDRTAQQSRVELEPVEMPILETR